MKQTVFADITSLVCHERTNRIRLARIKKRIRSDRMIRRAVVVDKETNVILDGHHRVRALSELGAKRVPVRYVRYRSSSVKVYLRRKNLLMNVVKAAVIGMVRSGGVFPSKTTRHILPHGQRGIPVPLTELY